MKSCGRLLKIENQVGSKKFSYYDDFSNLDQECQQEVYSYKNLQCKGCVITTVKGFLDIIIHYHLS